MTDSRTGSSRPVDHRPVALDAERRENSGAQTRIAIKNAPLPHLAGRRFRPERSVIQ